MLGLDQNFPNCIICDISLIAPSTNIPIAVHLLRQQGINVVPIGSAPIPSTSHVTQGVNRVLPGTKQTPSTLPSSIASTTHSGQANCAFQGTNNIQGIPAPLPVAALLSSSPQQSEFTNVQTPLVNNQVKPEALQGMRSLNPSSQIVRPSLVQGNTASTSNETLVFCDGSVRNLKNTPQGISAKPNVVDTQSTNTGRGPVSLANSRSMHSTQVPVTITGKSKFDQHNLEPNGSEHSPSAGDTSVEDNPLEKRSKDVNQNSTDAVFGHSKDLDVTSKSVNEDPNDNLTLHVSSPIHVQTTVQPSEGAQDNTSDCLSQEKHNNKMQLHSTLAKTAASINSTLNSSKTDTDSFPINQSGDLECSTNTVPDPRGSSMANTEMCDLTADKCNDCPPQGARSVGLSVSHCTVAAANRIVHVDVMSDTEISSVSPADQKPVSVNSCVVQANILKAEACTKDSKVGLFLSPIHASLSSDGNSRSPSQGAGSSFTNLNQAGPSTPGTSCSSFNCSAVDSSSDGKLAYHLITEEPMSADADTVTATVDPRPVSYITFGILCLFCFFSVLFAYVEQSTVTVLCY